MSWTGWGSWPGRRKRKYNRFWSSSKMREAIYEAKNFGIDHIRSKYGADRVNQIMSKLEAATKTPGRGSGSSRYTNQGGDGPGTRRYVQGRGYVKVGSSSWNRPRTPDASKHNAKANVKVGGRFADGGPSNLPPPPPPTDDNGFPPGTFRPRMKLNLENDEELAQGSQHPWAQPTSISSTITGLLRQAQNASPNYWSQWAEGKGGQYALDTRGSSSFGVDMRWDPNAPGAAQNLAMSNPMGAFGVNTVFQSPQAINQASTNPGWTPFGANSPGFMPADPPTTPPTTPPPATDPNAPPVYDTTGPIVPGDINPPNSNVFNPWARGEGGNASSYGPGYSPDPNNPLAQYMNRATMESMSLANAYFAPQRMELAYELGDMETDMRRLAVNLGRQVDDPVLQAKLYKEAMRATRTLDVQQNTFAFQMSEQRRREELQNFQFYDQLAQEEYRLRLANRQFYERLELDRRYYNLQNWNVMHPPTTPGSGTTVTPPPASGASRPPSMVQNQFPNPSGIYAPQPSIQGMANILGMNPYSSSGGGALVNRSVYPY